MDIDTFLTTLYVLVDDWYKQAGMATVLRRRGPKGQMSDSEVLTVALAGQWRAGVPWNSERSVVRYMQQQGRGWFPSMLGRSAFNARVRQLWGAFVAFQQWLAEAEQRANSGYEVVDCLPVPSGTLAQGRTERQHWLAEATVGYGGNQGGRFWGTQVLVSVNTQAYITGWVWGPAHTDDRWLLQALLSQRQGQRVWHGVWHGPVPWRPSRQRTPPEWTAPVFTSGNSCDCICYLADKGFNGLRWHNHWWQQYGVDILTPPSRGVRGVRWPRSWARAFQACRQTIETTFALLTTVFDVKRLRAHSRWGTLTRLSIVMAAYNCGIYLNRSLGRPARAHATLIA